MGLRSQLFAIGLVTLLLPWSAWMVLGEMEAALRNWQAQSATTIARMVANKILENGDLLLPLDRAAERVQSAGSVWPVPLTTYAPVLDGYLDDWDAFPVMVVPCLSGVAQQSQVSPKSYCRALRTRERLYLAVEVLDTDRQFDNPTQESLGSDFIRLNVRGGQSRRELLIDSSAAGVAKVARLRSGQPITPEYRVKAHWSEHAHGYVVELSLPLAWIDRGLSVAVHDNQLASELEPMSSSLPIPVLQDFDLTNALESVQATGSKISVVADGRWVVAQAGSLETASASSDKSWAHWLLKQLLEPRLTATGSTFEHMDLGRGQAESQWLSKPNSWRRADGQPVLTIVLPLDGFQSAGLYVVVEQASKALNDMTSGTLGKLLLYLGLLGGMVALGLLAYATWISLRVRLLRQTVLAASDAQGKLRGDFTPSQARDEIGDLSRAYAILLNRLRGYTSYLERLSQQLSHELRTPLGIVQSSLDNIRQLESTGAETEVYLTRASNGVQRLSSILHAMSNAARLEQSLESTELSPVNLNALLSDLALVYSDLYADVDIRFVNTTDRDVWVLACADLIAQMLDKLFDNAHDFSAPGEPIELTLSASPDWSVIALSNRGDPIDPQELGHLFEPLVCNRRGPSEGAHLGLGLYVVKTIVSFLAGDVRVQNNTQKQTVEFIVRLPRHPHSGE